MTSLITRIKNSEMTKICSIAMATIIVALAAFLAQAASGLANLFTFLPCYFLLGQPEIPASMLQKISDKETK